MKGRFILLVLFFSLSLQMIATHGVLAATPVFINEIHYDNSGADSGEAIEVAGPAGTDLTGWKLVLYNGGNGASYATMNLSGTLANHSNGHGALSFSYSGIQNGAPDGIALVNSSGVLVQFLSYEGSFTASGGAANGVTSTNIGVAETDTTPTGHSLQLSGTGTSYEDFTWQAASTATMGQVNNGQSFGEPPPVGGPFTIYHMNDAHSRLLPHEFDVPGSNDVVEMEMVGGAAYFGAKLLALKAAQPDSLVLDGGDLSEGSPIGDLRGNGGIIDFYNLLDTKLKNLGGRGLDAVVVGNHDVRSLQMLTNLKSLAQGGKAQFPALSVNICHEGTQTPYFTPYVTMTINGTKVGILGYTTDTSAYLGADTDGLIDVVKCTWAGGSGIISIRDWVNTLRTTEHCDVVVLLSHVGQSRVSSGTDALIVDTGDVKPPEVVISGHWHTWSERVWQPSNLNGKTIVAEAASYLQYIGEINLSNSGGYVDARKHVIRNSEITLDGDIATLVNNLINEYNTQVPAPAHALNEVIGYSAIDLSMDKDKWWTVSEYPWAATNSAGAWITDTMAWKAAQLGHPVDLAIQSGGGIRRDIASGPVTYIEIYECYPWSDDNMVRVQMTGQEIWNWIQETNLGTSVSEGWMINAHDGVISSITYQGNPINLAGTYNVAISEYMFAHPEISLSDTTPEDLGYSIREGVVDYTRQYNTSVNPMYPNGISTRYNLNTEFAGGFKAVVTMVADDESQPYFEEAFIRLIEALPSTLARRNSYGLSELVNSDGSINQDNRFAEIMLYRSHLGLPNGALKNGDIIEVWGEGTAFEGTPEFVDQEGIYGPNQEFMRHGSDATLARPEFYPTIAALWDDWHDNHYVKFYAEKSGTSTVRDAAGQQITIYEPGGYYSKTLPGSVGEILQLTGVTTQEGATRLFRCNAATVASNGYPASSSVNTIDPYAQSGTGITLTATASDAAGAWPGVAITSAADTQVVEGNASSNYGSSTSMYVQSSSGSSYKNERGWVQFNLNSKIPAGATITSAKLKLYCWRAQGSDMAASVHGATDGWTESGLTWATQPGYGAALDTVTLVSGQTGVWYQWDVTNYVVGEAAGDQLVSLLVKAVSENNATDQTYTFDSKEYSGGTLAPVLEIEWESGGTTTPVPTQVEFFYRYAPDGLAWTEWISIGTDTIATDGWQRSFTYLDGQGSYEFYSVATDVDGNVEDAVVRADTRALFNNVPAEPINSGVEDGSTSASLNPTLSVTVSDADGSPVTVSFYDSNDTLIGTVSNVLTGGTASVVWNSLEESRQYRWYAVTNDGLGTTISPMWTFTTESLDADVPIMGNVATLVAMLTLLLTGVVRQRRRH
jgi:2',3'-cyclic-nucleotide 2'-phosphodiesterase (5'-nucleotidase family)